jgi:hypothetical protein
MSAVAWEIYMNKTLLEHAQSFNSSTLKINHKAYAGLAVEIRVQSFSEPQKSLGKINYTTPTLWVPTTNHRCCKFG